MAATEEAGKGGVMGFDATDYREHHEDERLARPEPDTWDPPEVAHVCPWCGAKTDDPAGWPEDIRDPEYPDERLCSRGCLDEINLCLKHGG